MESFQMKATRSSTTSKVVKKPGTLQKWCVARERGFKGLFVPISLADADPQLRRAGIGTDEDIMIMVLTTRDNAAIAAAQTYYEGRFDESLIDKVRA